MGFTDDLLADLAGHLQNAGLASWRPAGQYEPDDPLPVFMTSVPAAPDRVLVMTPYAVGDDPSLSDSVQGVQMWLRGDRDPRTVQADADALLDALHGAHGLLLPSGRRVPLTLRTSGTYLAADENGRHQRSENYHLTVWRPSPHRT